MHEQKESQMETAKESGCGNILTTFASKKQTKPSKQYVLTWVYIYESSVTRNLCFLQNADRNTRRDGFVFS